MGREFNETLRRSMISAGGILLSGAIVGLLALWHQSVSAADVSRQIQLESPYVQDRELIRRAVRVEIPEIRRKLDSVRTEQIEQRAILERIQRSLERGHP